LILVRLLPDALAQSALTAARRIADAIFIGQLLLYDALIRLVK
jgi:hypothetical protein